VWFGCDVGKHSDSKLGIMDTHLLDYKLLFDVDFQMKKADRLLYGDSAMTHAMVFTGLQKDSGSERALRWKVENSWGTQNAIFNYESVVY
jgi:bleomycin hydrolase